MCVCVTDLCCHFARARVFEQIVSVTVKFVGAFLETVKFNVYEASSAHALTCLFKRILRPSTLPCVYDRCMEMYRQTKWYAFIYWKPNGKLYCKIFHSMNASLEQAMRSTSVWSPPPSSFLIIHSTRRVYEIFLFQFYFCLVFRCSCFFFSCSCCCVAYMVSVSFDFQFRYIASVAFGVPGGQSFFVFFFGLFESSSSHSKLPHKSPNFFGTRQHLGRHSRNSVFVIKLPQYRTHAIIMCRYNVRHQLNFFFARARFRELSLLNHVHLTQFNGFHKTLLEWHKSWCNRSCMYGLHSLNKDQWKLYHSYRSL